MRGGTVRALLWFDNYSLLRSQFGILAAVEYLFQGSDAVDEAIAEALAGSAAATTAEAGAKKAEARAIGNAVSTGIMAVGGALQVVPVVGNIAGAIVAAVGAVVRGLVALFTAECDKYECPKPVSYHRRALVGVFPPPGATILSSKGRINYFGRRGLLGKYMHDGLVEQGFGEVGTDEDMGRVVGVNSFTKSKSKRKKYRNEVNNIWKHWKNATYTPDLPDGDSGNMGAKAKKGTYAYRARKVYWLLCWIEGKVACQVLKCMQEALRGTVGEKDITIAGHKFKRDLAEQRMRGSRWYASIFQMMRDFWVMGEALGAARTKVILDDARATKAATAWKDLHNGAKPESAKLYFPWSSVMGHLSFDALRGLLRSMSKELHKSTDSDTRRVVEVPTQLGDAVREQEKSGRLQNASFRAVQTPKLALVQLSPINLNLKASSSSSSSSQRPQVSVTSTLSNRTVTLNSSSSAASGGRTRVQPQQQPQGEQPSSSGVGTLGMAAAGIALVALLARK